MKTFNKLYDFGTYSSLDVNLSKIKIMIFSRDKRKLNQETFYLHKDQIGIPHDWFLLT
jgi:hypothetical protein